MIRPIGIGLFILFSLPEFVFSQALENISGDVSHIEKNRRYASSWIMHPAVKHNDHAVVLFRKSFSLADVPSSFIIHISADNRYRLFVNGIFASKGPARSDLDHWYYETLDLAPLLKSGDNVLAVEVVNFGIKRTWSQFSAQTNLFVQGHTADESIVNTLPGTWLCWQNRAYHPNVVEWINGKDIAFGLYVAHPTDSMIAEYYPWGWEKPQYDDQHWINAVWSNNAGGRETQYAGGINYPGGKLLVPRPTRLLREVPERFTSIIRNEWIEPPERFLKGQQDLIIPPERSALILIDQKYLTLGYPELLISNGKGAMIRIGYAETLYEKNRRTKGNRNNYNDKIFIGIKDVFIPDGGAKRLFRPLSHRTFRFIQLEIETGEQPLIIHDFYYKKTGYPIDFRASFVCDDKKLNGLMIPGWRTASVCAQDILMSDAYYEQMQYVGDCKVHNLAILYLSGNDDLVRNQLTQTNWSRIPDGLTLACYPNNFHLVIPFYSLLWIDMLYDYMMWSGDKYFISQFELGINNVLSWYEKRMLDNNLLGPLEWWNDVDWSPGFPNGVPPGIQNGQSALFSLQYAISLKKASEIERFSGNQIRAEDYSKRSSKIIAAVNELCFDKKLGLYAETPDFNDFSQHTNILAVLAGAVKDEEAKQIMIKVMNDSSLHQTALFFRYFLMDALIEAGLPQKFFDQLEPWHEMMEKGLTTFTEIPVSWENQRSDCHPWSTSPNIHFFKTICGIKVLKPGFSNIEINPTFGPLERIEARLPIKSGEIEIRLTKTEGNARGEIRLPTGVSGSFHFQDQQIELREGLNVIR